MVARATLTKTSAPGKYASAGVDLTLMAADVANKNQFRAAGGELVIAQNTDVGPQTVTITSTPDPFGRTKDVTAHSIPAGGIAVFGPFPTVGWQQPDGYVYLEASAATVKFAVITQS